VDVDEPHRAGEARVLIGDSVLDALGSLLSVLEEGGVRLQGDVSYALEKADCSWSSRSFRKEVGVVIHL
jgi:hypothetical protein